MLPFPFMTRFRMVFTTASSQREARKLARLAVENKLAACVNIIPRVESVYRWQGKIKRDGEWLLLMKTSAEKVDALRQAISAAHSYDLPEFLVVNIDDGSAEYLLWLADSVGAKQSSRGISHA